VGRGARKMSRELLLEIKLPYQKPQNVLVRKMNNGLYRLALFDRFDRVEYLNGEYIGFGVIMFNTCKFPRIVRLVLKDTWDEGLYRNFEGQTVNIEVREIHEL
jgi:hypothetical protein